MYPENRKTNHKKDDPKPNGYMGSSSFSETPHRVKSEHKNTKPTSKYWVGFVSFFLLSLLSISKQIVGYQ